MNELNNFLAIDKLTEEIMTIENAQERNTLDAIHNYLCDYINNDVTGLVANSIIENEKTMTDAMAYCTQEAQKAASSGVRCAMVNDDDVYSWIINYFINDEIEAKQTSRGTVAKGTTKPKSATPTPKKKPAVSTNVKTVDNSETQTDIFDFLD